MKKIFAIAFILTACINAAFAVKKYNKEFVIAIHAAHGGPDNGATAKDGTFEKAYTLAYSLELKKIAEAQNFKVVMCREDDINFDLSKRAEFIQQNKADVFISLHFNTDKDNAEKRGFECYVATENQAMENKILGKFMGAELYNIKGMKFNGVNTRQMNVLNTLPSPVALLELGYMSNDKDLAFIQSESGKKEVCEKILNAIMRYKAQLEMDK